MLDEEGARSAQTSVTVMSHTAGSNRTVTGLRRVDTLCTPLNADGVSLKWEDAAPDRWGGHGDPAATAMDRHDLEVPLLSQLAHVTVLREESGVPGKEMDQGSNGDTTEERRLKRWVNSVGTVTLPLLAGFSITAVVVSDDAANFRWPGPTILVLALAALALLAAVQCAYHAHLYLSKKDPDHKKGLDWARRTRRFYDYGLLAVIAGLGLVVLPRHDTGIQAVFQWAAVLVTCAVWGVEFFWKRREDRSRSG